MATIRETFFDMVLPSLPFEPRTQSKLVSATNARDWQQVLATIGKGPVDFTKPPCPLTSVEQALFNALPIIYAEFNNTENDNSIYSLINFMKAPSDDVDGITEIMAKLNIDPAGAAKQEMPELKEHLKKHCFAPCLALCKKCELLDLDGCKFRAYVNYTSKADELWARFVTGTAIWLVADEKTLSINSWMAFRDVVASKAALEGEVKSLTAEVAALKTAKPKATSDPAKDARIRELEAEIKRISKRWTWSTPQKAEIKAAWEKIETGIKCCYPDSAADRGRQVAICMAILEERGPDAFTDLMKVMNDEIARWDGKEHVDGTKDPEACKVFELEKYFDKELAACMDKWAVPGANSGKTVAIPAKKSGWFAATFINPLTSWWAKRRKQTAYKHASSKLGAEADSWAGKWYSNWANVLVAPMRAFEDDSHKKGTASWTLGLLGSVLVAPFVLVGSVLNLGVDAASKLFTGTSVTSNWWAKSFGGAKQH